MNVLLLTLILLQVIVPLYLVTGTKVKWGEWSQWSSCSVTCGGGSKQRIAYKFDDQGRMTNDTFRDMGGCYIDKLCPVNGNWTMWYPWSACSRMCGSGTKIRKRTCENPKPSNGGLPCSGVASESEICNTKACPRIPPDFNIRICINEDMFMCESKIHCINKTLRCDKTLQCNDGSDEKQCWSKYRSGQDTIYQGSKLPVLLTVINILIFIVIQR